MFPKLTSLEDTVLDRYSIVYFCHPVGGTPLTPIPSEVVRSMGERGANATAGPEGGVLTADAHLRGRLRATYAYGWKDEGKNGA